MAQTTVANLWLQYLPDALYASGNPHPSLSQKPWITAYPEVRNTQVYAATIESITAFLAADHAVENPNAPMYTNEPSDMNRLGRPVFSPNYPSVEHVHTEGDVVRDFVKNIAAPVSLAWSEHMNHIERSESGPPGPGQSTTTQTIDYYVSWQRGGRADSERCIVVGDLKKPGIIRIREWDGRDAMSVLSHRLGREMRGYAFLYNCPQVFVYDGIYLLILQFKATSRDDIKSNNCQVGCCIIPRDDIGVLRYGLYRLRWRGWMRLVGETAADRVITFNGWVRSFRYWSGRPMWRSQGFHSTTDHPNGYVRRLDLEQNCWYWELNGQPVLDADGNTIWETWNVMS